MHFKVDLDSDALFDSDDNLQIRKTKSMCQGRFLVQPWRYNREEDATLFSFQDF